MARGRFSAMMMVGTLLAVAVPALAQRGAGWGMQGSGNDGLCRSLIDSLPAQPLDTTEAAGLAYMREEEKLARDVYSRLYVKWGSPIFANISQSEERHFDALKLLLDRYGLVDPAANTGAGIFKDPALQTLYNALTAKGEASLAGAMRAGATIEDLDIRDLGQALAATDNGDFKVIYQNLQRGSRNHMRAFAGQLAALGEIYTPQYIDAAVLAGILAGPHEAGMGYGRGGNGPAAGGPGSGVCPLGNTPGSNSGAGRRRGW